MCIRHHNKYTTCHHITLERTTVCEHPRGRRGSKDCGKKSSQKFYDEQGICLDCEVKGVIKEKLKEIEMARFKKVELARLWREEEKEKEKERRRSLSEIEKERRRSLSSERGQKWWRL